MLGSVVFIFRDVKNPSGNLSTTSSNFCSIILTLFHITDISRKHTQSWKSNIFSVEIENYFTKVTAATKSWTSCALLLRENIILQTRNYCANSTSEWLTLASNAINWISKLEDIMLWLSFSLFYHHPDSSCTTL